MRDGPARRHPARSLTQIAAGATWHAVSVHRYVRTANVCLAEHRENWCGPWKELPVRLIPASPQLRPGSAAFCLSGQ
jgi:hypothetical protein